MNEAAVGAAGDSRAAGAAGDVGRGGGGQAWNESEEHGGQHGESGGDPEERRIEGQVESADGEARGILSEHGHHGLRNENADGGAGSAEQQAFGEESAAERGVARAERLADGEFTFAAHGTGEHEVRDIRAGDDKQQSGGGEQDPKNGAGLGSDLVAEEGYVDLRVVSVGLGMLLDHGGVRAAHIGARRFDGGSGSQAAEELRHAVDAALHHGGGEMVRAGDDVCDDFGIGGIGNAGLEDADDGGGTGAEADGLAEDRGIGVERVRPEVIGQHRCARSGGAVVGGAEKATEHGGEAHDVEVRPADDAGADFARLAQANHFEANDGEIAEGADGGDFGLEVQNFGDGEVGVLNAFGRSILADVDEAGFVTNGRRRTPRTRVKMAALPPMPSARVRMTVKLSPLARTSERNANLISLRKLIHLPFYSSGSARISPSRSKRRSHMVRLS
jgi:hypothetical protein